MIEKLIKLAADEQLLKESDIADQDTWKGYHGRQKQVRPKKKLYFRVHGESFD